ncbi:extracellular solute-binding protein, partial [Escherichia coli]
ETAAVYDDLVSIAKSKDGKSALMSLIGTGLVYNKDYFASQGWEAPSSWDDLKDKKFSKKIVVPPINNTYGLIALVAAARQSGGGETSIDAGFDAFANEIGPNVLTYEPSPGKMSELFQSGQAVLGVWGTSRAKVIAESGFPMGFVYPKEGGYAIGVAICPVAGGQDKPEAQGLIQHILSQESQRTLAVTAALGPVNSKVELKPEEQKGIPYGSDQISQLKVIDWPTVNREREQWNRRWTREIER